MKEILDLVCGPLTITEDTIIRGMVSAGLTVAQGANVIINGMVTGDLIINKGCCVTINGMINGKVINNGADVELFGVIDSLQDNNPHKRTVVHQVAQIRNF